VSLNGSLKVTGAGVGEGKVSHRPNSEVSGFVTGSNRESRVDDVDVNVDDGCRGGGCN
jgi:hypothetical protein